MEMTTKILIGTLFDASSNYFEGDRDELLGKIKEISSANIVLDGPLTKEDIVAFADISRVDTESVFFEDYETDTLPIHTNHGDITLNFDPLYGKAEFHHEDITITVKYSRNYHKDHYDISVKDDKHPDRNGVFKTEYSIGNDQVTRDARKIVGVVLDGVDAKVLDSAIHSYYRGIEDPNYPSLTMSEAVEAAKKAQNKSKRKTNKFDRILKETKVSEGTHSNNSQSRDDLIQ